MLKSLIAIFAIYTLIKITLSILQINFINKEVKKSAVVLSPDEFISAAKVAKDNEKFSIITNIFSFFTFILWAVFGLRMLQDFIVQDQNNINEQTIFVLSFLIIQSILSLPIDIYEKFVKDKKHGFSKITPKIFILDILKSLGLSVVFGGAFVWVLLWIIHATADAWWILGFAFSFVVILIINLIYPTIIAPLFNKMSPLSDDELSAQIDNLMKKSGFASSGIFVMDASKRDGRLNAYFGGLGKNKRVVLFDTLLQKLDKNEILAVLGHELGHFKHKDILKMIALSAAMIFAIFFIFGHIPSSAYESLGMGGAGAMLVFLVLFGSIISLIFSPIIGAISRLNEFNADEYGAKMQSKDDMISALKKLGSQNKAFPKAHPLYATIYHSHPSLFERISELENES